MYLRRDALENRQRIENKAIELFNQLGVQQVSMNRIAKELNIGMGTLYRHFKDKSALCTTIIEHDFTDIINQMYEVKEKNHDSKAVMAKSLDIFLNFKTINSDLLHCIEDTTDKNDFYHSDIYLQLFKFYSEILGNNKSTTWTTFKVDMLLKSLSTKSFELQKDERGLSNETIRDYIIKLYFDKEE